ncbi:SWPV1-309 [Shearwaterpox virus]|uniref:SWPV1-002 n=1 Tax=Shearwaterpox virus TaxID=1974596 RepID=A0A1V0S8B8_CNPV|nr:SWPV1-002 [Shearwaterpox virus]ARF02868.1 SWPV1-309 [Shearwaterpox virus]
MDVRNLYYTVHVGTDNEVLSSIREYEKHYTYDLSLVRELSPIENMLRRGYYFFHHSPLHQAVQLRRTEVVRSLLLDRKYLVKSVDKYLLPLHLIAISPSYFSWNQEVLYFLKEILTSSDDIHNVNKYLIQIISKISNYIFTNDLPNNSIYIAIIKEIMKGKLSFDKKEIMALSKDIDEQELIIANILLDNGAPINAVDGYGYTALHYAAKFAKKDLVEILLRRGADINMKTCYESTAFEMAVCTNNIDLVNTMLTYHDNYKKEKNVLLEAINSHYIREEVISYLIIDLGFDINDRDNLYGETILERAIILDKPYKMIKLLLDLGADPNVDASILERFSRRRLTIYEEEEEEEKIYVFRYIISKILLLQLMKPDIKSNEMFTRKLEVINSNNIMRDQKIKCDEEIERIKSTKIFPDSLYTLDALIRINDVNKLYKIINNYDVSKIDVSSFDIYKETLEKSIQKAVLRNC